MSKKSEIHNTQEIEKLLEVARFTLDLCQLYGATKITQADIKAILDRELVISHNKPSAFDYNLMYKVGTLYTIPEVPELEILGED